ncbi:ATP-dependent nuclease [Lentzea aerocolonigenes]|uniref:ATP-dependent nuclease n=1 Tax=Lentzea aerocolonigenes TaxID=68170 RepID=UPI0004C2DC7C|nr:AAA family ATPase [Lentzea aerocolonigenes]MCP2242712.1 putative ATP-dependent endonuclease of the OLD family, contains P-loop ATPase and TOPRIM domains [Lentzea aerocolonigenes]
MAHLQSYSVRGFRSLADVAEIPISKPTILAGPNDGGKSAALGALGFLLGTHKLTDDDRTYLAGQAGERQSHVEVTGTFSLDVLEQEAFALPASVRVRRIAEAGADPRYQIWAAMPDDEDLRDLDSKRVPELRTLAVSYGMGLAKANKPELLTALREHAAKHSSSQGWTEVPRGLLDRMPRLAAFDGTALQPEAAIRSVLSVRFKSYLDESAVRGQIEELATDATNWLAIEAKPLADHIAERCPDIATVTVEPTVTVAPVLGPTSLRLERASGEAVRLDRSGQGSARRISMAVWEATSELLDSPAADCAEAVMPPVQSIVVYDEPDTHLDYHFQREVMRLIREQANLPHVSVVVATHSMNLIDGVDIRDVVLLRLDEHRRTLVERLGTAAHADFDRHLGAVAAAVGLRNSVLLHERCFLAVEGETEQQAIPVLFALSEGLSLQAAGIALWACGGNDGALHLASYLVKHDRTVVLMIDADSETQSRIFSPANLSTKFGTRQEEVVSWLGKSTNKKELEELFDDDIWARTANVAWPRPGGDWTAADFTAQRGEGKFSDKVARMLREQSENFPRGKPAMVLEVTMRLEEPDQVPRELRDTFARLRKLASQ